MIKKVSIVFLCFCLVFMFLFFKIGVIASNTEYKQTALNQSHYTLELPSQRKNIYDCNMEKIVNEDYKYIASVTPTEEAVSILKEHKVGITSSEIDEIVKEGKPFLCEVDSLNIQANGIKVFTVYDRYSQNQLANHIVGYLDNKGEGITGLEKGYDDILKIDKTTSLTYTVDALGVCRNEVEPKIEYGDSTTDGVVTTLDKNMQRICENIGNKYLDKGAIIVMECDTGEIKASCSFPNYNRYNLQKSVTDEKGKPMINRAFTDTNVGSTFKIVTTATALYDGVSSNTTYNCTGYFDLYNSHINCHKLDGHGVLDMKTALMESCNPYFINLGLGLNNKNFIRIANDMSFGKGYELAKGIYTDSGYLPSFEELQNKGELANFSFGQGTLSATPVQLAQMISCIVNGGVTPTPKLIKGIYQNDKIEEVKYQEPIKALSEDIANTIKDYLISCVMEKDGQNAKPFLNTAGGKTGTAQTGIYENGEELCNGWFAGFFSSNEKNYAVVVLAEDASYGNEDASPVFREIVDTITVLQQQK